MALGYTLLPDAGARQPSWPPRPMVAATMPSSSIRFDHNRSRDYGVSKTRSYRSHTAGGASKTHRSGSHISAAYQFWHSPASEFVMKLLNSDVPPAFIAQSPLSPRQIMRIGQFGTWVARLDSCAVRKYFGIAARFALCAEWDIELIPEMEGAFKSLFQYVAETARSIPEEVKSLALASLEEIIDDDLADVREGIAQL